MIRFVRIALGSVASVAVLVSVIAARHDRSASPSSTVPPACALLTTTEAGTLGGFPASVDSTGDISTGNSCVFKRTGAGELDPDVVEITTRTYADAPTAHADYPKWVNPLLKPSAIMIWTPITGVGDEATLSHTTLKPGSAGIYFRSGAVNVKVGVYPVPTDSALAAAGKTMVSRM
jgi:hypothetical protein